MYPLDARFNPSPGYRGVLAGIEPPCDDKDTVMWTKEATKKSRGVDSWIHEMSLLQ